MSMTDSSFRTITCNGPECPKTVTFLLSKEGHQAALVAEGNEWLKTVRFIQTSDGRSFAYCSDTCEVKGAGTGEHNIPEPKKIITGVATAAQIQAAADAAKAAEAATAAMKAGGPVSIR